MCVGECPRASPCRLGRRLRSAAAREAGERGHVTFAKLLARRADEAEAIYRRVLTREPSRAPAAVALARLLIDEARQRSLRLVAAESCTGGLVAGAICSISGASDVFERGFVTYTNRAKSEMLGVPGDLIADLEQALA